MNVHIVLIPIRVTRVPICCSRLVPVKYTGREYVYTPSSVCVILAVNTITSYKLELSTCKLYSNGTSTASMEVEAKYVYVHLVRKRKKKMREASIKIKRDIKMKQFH